MIGVIAGHYRLLQFDHITRDLLTLDLWEE